MNTWLIYPPFADPTQPYGSLPLLKGYLRSQRLDATVVDLNLTAARHLLGRNPMRTMAETVAERFADLNTDGPRSFGEQMHYLALAEAIPAARRVWTAPDLPEAIFYDPRRFFDLKQYNAARNLAEDALRVTSAAGYPYTFHFNKAGHLAVPWGRHMLKTYYAERRSPLDDLYRSFVSQCRFKPGDAVGISLTFISQIPEAFYLLQLVRDLAPTVKRVIGGSCLQQFLQHASEAVRRWVVTVADAACTAEGEDTLVQLLSVWNDRDAQSDPRMRSQRLAAVPNLLYRDPLNDDLCNGPTRISQLDALPEPDFSDLDLDGYLAPERTLLFAPTRGCYWNRCSFCDYGLNRDGRHGYREMPSELAAEQMVALSRKYGVDHIYLSVDVMTPHFAEALANALVTHQSTVRWSSDFRIDDAFSAERCGLLARSGLYSVAFGVESGADSLLRRMHKGITVKTLRAVNTCFHKAGIATAWMMFSDHPGETQAEAMASIRLVAEERRHVDQFILGRFGLTSGSDIACRPERYGIQRVFYCSGDDFRLFPLFDMAHEARPESSNRLEKEVARLSDGYYLDHYPWAGAISTHHSLLYQLKFGPSVFRKPPPSAKGRRPAGRRGPRLPKVLTADPIFDLGPLQTARERWLHGLWQTGLAIGPDGHAPLDQTFYQSSLDRRKPIRLNAQGRLPKRGR